MKIFVINLDRSKDRWARMQRAMSDAGFSETEYERFSGVDGKKLDPEYIRSILSVRAYFDLNRPRYEHRMFNSLGAVGCYLSHLSVAQKIVNDNLPHALVLEDDGIPNKDAKSKLEKMFSAGTMPTDGDFYILSAAFLPNGMIKSVNNDWFRLYNIFFGMQAYILTNSGARKILANAFPFEMHVDAYVGTLASIPEKDFKLYALKRAESKSKSPFRFGGIKSTVQSDRSIFENPFLANHPKDFSPTRPWGNIPMCVTFGLFLLVLFLLGVLIFLKNSRHS